MEGSPLYLLIWKNVGKYKNRYFDGNSNNYNVYVLKVIKSCDSATLPPSTQVVYQSEGNPHPQPARKETHWQGQDHHLVCVATIVLCLFKFDCYFAEVMTPRTGHVYFV